MRRMDVLDCLHVFTIYVLCSLLCACWVASVSWTSLSQLGCLNRIQWSWVQILLRPTFYGPSVVNTKYIGSFHYIHMITLIKFWLKQIWWLTKAIVEMKWNMTLNKQWICMTYVYKEYKIKMKMYRSNDQSQKKINVL